MNTKAIKNWSGLAAASWMMGAFVLIHYVIVPDQIVIGPFWVWIFVSVAIQLIPGLALAVAGLGCVNRLGRATAILACVLFLWFVWYGAVPALLVFKQGK